MFRYEDFVFELEVFAARGVQTIIEGMRKRSSDDRRTAAEGATHARVATSAAEIDAARALMLRDCREAMETINRGGQLTLEQRARNRRDIAYVAYQCTQAVDRLFASAGGSNIYLASEAQRLLRDIHAAGQHISFSWDVAATTYGRVAFGLPPGQEV